MQKILLLLYFLILSMYVHAQSDFILLKKRHKTIETFFEGSFINCKTNSGEWVDGYISKIANDTFYVKPFELVHFVNAWGMPAVDTLWRHERGIAIKEVAAFPNNEESFSYLRNGDLLKIGSAGYIILNVINTLSSGDALFDNGNAKRLGIAAAVFLLGVLLDKSHSTELRIGKKYKLQYVKVSSST